MYSTKLIVMLNSIIDIMPVCIFSAKKRKVFVELMSEVNLSGMK